MIPEDFSRLLNPALNTSETEGTLQLCTRELNYTSQTTDTGMTNSKSRSVHNSVRLSERNSNWTARLLTLLRLEAYTHINAEKTSIFFVTLPPESLCWCINNTSIYWVQNRTNMIDNTDYQRLDHLSNRGHFPHTPISSWDQTSCVWVILFCAGESGLADFIRQKWIQSNLEI